MDITYNNYPGLLFTSYNKDTAPDELPFEVASQAVRMYLSRSTGFHEMWAIIGTKNSLDDTATNYELSDRNFSRIDSNHDFRNSQFRAFFENYVKPKYGNIAFKEGGHYVYLLLSKQETKQLKNADGRYMAVALFRQNFFIGFEEAIITEKGLKVMETGHYEGGMDVGGYLSFCIIALAYANQANPSLTHYEKIKETLWML